LLSQTVPCISFPINKHPISQKHHLLWQKFTDLNFSIHWNHTTKAQTHLVCKPWGSFAVNIHNSVQIVLFCHTSGWLPLPCLPTMLHYTIHAKEHTSSILGSLLILEQSRSHRAWISILIRNRVPPIFKQQPWLTISNTWQTATTKHLAKIETARRSSRPHVHKCRSIKCRHLCETIITYAERWKLCITTSCNTKFWLR
jgi:hypothetical protein